MADLTEIQRGRRIMADITGKPSTSDGSTPFPNDEILKGRQIMKDIASGRKPSGEPQGRLARGAARAEKKKSERRDFWKELPGYAKNVKDQYANMSPTEVMSAVAINSPGRAALGAGLLALGGAGQRLESLAGSAMKEWQSQRLSIDPRVMVKQRGRVALQALKGLTLNGQDEWGDAYLRSGYPEWLASTMGLITASVLDPTKLAKFLGTSVRKATAKAVAKTGAAVGEGSGRAVAALFHRADKKLRDFIFNTRFGFMKSKYGTPEAIDRLVSEGLDANVASYTKHAGQLYDNIKTTRLAAHTPFKGHKQLLQKLDDMLGDSAQLNRLSEDKLARFMIKLRGKVQGEDAMRHQLNNMQDVLWEMDGLKKVAEHDYPTYQVVDTILDEVEKQMPAFATARAAWKDQSIMHDLLDKMIGRAERGASGTFRPGGINVTSYWSNPKLQQRTSELQQLFDKVGIRLPIEDTIKCLGANARFGQLKPQLTPLILGAYTRSILTDMGTIPPEAVTGALQGGSLVAASAQGFGRMGRTMMQGGTKLRALAGKAEPYMGAIDYGIQRQLTGRNE